MTASAWSDFLDAVMRNVVIGPWYDDPANDPGAPAVARLHAAEAAMWRLYDLLGLDPGDGYQRPATLVDHDAGVIIHALRATPSGERA